MRLALLIAILVPLTGSSQPNDTTLNAVLAQGRFSIHARTFFMATANDGDLSDYHALAIGAGVGYESPEFKKFKIGISGFFIYNALSSDLSKPDPLSGALNRYEIGLFDLTDPKNHKDLDRLEELYLQYRIHQSFFRVGKIIVNTPFINPQDGRMRPTLEQGIWTDVHEIKNTTIYVGWLTHISPRSTVRWYKVEESIGVYPVGIDESGIRSDYAGNVESKGIGLLGVDIKNKVIRISLWNTLIENISNTVFVQVEKDIQVRNRFYYGGAQLVRQDAIESGGSSISTQTYMSPGSYSNIVSGRIGLRNDAIDLNINGTIFSTTARFLMPREWGKDPFYTFLPRERNEGFGGVKAVSLNLTYTVPVSKVKLAFGVGHYDLPDVKEYSLNKYAMPSYAQLNFDVRYNLSGFLKGTSLQFLYVYKMGTGHDYENAKNIFNKVNMSNINVVVNYRVDTHHPKSDR